MSLYTPEKIFSAQKSNLDLLQKVSAQVFEGAEKLAALQLRTLRSAADEQFATLSQLLNVRDAEGLAKVQAGLTTPVAQIERAAELNREIYDLVSATQTNIVKLVEQHVESGTKQVQEIVEEVARNAPAGAEPVVTAFKTAVESANSLYENSQKAARQVAEMAEGGITAATNAATQAAKAVSSKTA